jgi:hypothetical protein
VVDGWLIPRSLTSASIMCGGLGGRARALELVAELFQLGAATIRPVSSSRVTWFFS